MSQVKYRHKKTGNIYYVLNVATDCTNNRAGTPVVLYVAKNNVQKLYVRDQTEFNEKFEPL